MSDNYFSKLYAINVSEHVEQKGKFNYLSWAYAVKTLREVDPTATWEIIRFDGLPFLKTECGYFVEVAVTVQGITLSQIHPVLNNNNAPIPQPNSFQINTSIQRALVKAIALHGLGLYIYAGEDLPCDDTTAQTPVQQPKQSQPSPSQPTAQTPVTSQSTTTSELISDAQIGFCKKIMKEKDISGELYIEMIKKYGVTSTKSLTKSQASKFIKELQDYVPDTKEIEISDDDLPF